MVKESELATPAEVAEAVDQARRELADKAAAEIMEGESQGVNALIDLYDSEIALIEWEVRELNDKTVDGRPVDRTALHTEIIDRFAAIGLVVKVLWYYSQVPGVYIPEVQIVGRTDKLDEFDHDRQQHEVIHDVLETGERGEIRADGGLWTPGS